MKIKPFFSVVLIVVAGLMSDSLLAQETKLNPPVRSGQTPQAGQLDEKTIGNVVRASQLIGQKIENTAGESIGKVEDIVLDGRSMRVQYAAVTYGGFLGFRNKLFAVPMEAIQLKRRDNDRRDIYLSLDVSQEKLDMSEGFDEDHWPNGADPEFQTKIRQRYGVNPDSDHRK